jgi:hypothetical protein
MFKKGTSFWIHKVPFFPGGSKIIPHFVDGHGDNIIHIEDRNTPLEILEGVFDALVNLFSCPHIAVFEILKDVNLPGSLWCALFPPTPGPVIVEIVLSGAGFKDLISGFGPGEFVFNFFHWHW